MTDDAVALYGTHEPVPPQRRLRAGTLEAVFDGTGLRWISWRGVELVRGITFLVRDDAWRTPAGTISDLAVEEGDDRFSVAFTHDVSVDGARLRSRVAYEADATGRLEARVTVHPLTDFLTNRTGFVVLHPLEGVAGAPVEVEHVDGVRERVVLGATINPAQPLKDIRALTHEAAPGLAVTVRMDGDTFEMEDHRNWSDASFKTYSRPLSLPFPYRLLQGEDVSQAVTLTVDDRAAGQGTKSAGAAAHQPCVVVGDPLEVAVPRIGLALEAEHAAQSLAAADLVRAARPSFILALVDQTRGAGNLVAVRDLAARVGCPVQLHLVVAGKDDPAAEVGRAAAEAAAAGLSPEAVAVFPKVDEISFQPSQERPPCPTLESLYEAARTAFPHSRIGGGSPAFFPELNRKRPPAEHLDFVVNGGCAIVHAADDASVMETLEAWPWIVRSARAFIAGAAYHLGPMAIGARLNPYGAAPADNPGNARLALARVDPRQRGLFGAAWHAGLVAAVAPLGVPEIAMGAPTGPFGIVHAPQDFGQPGFDGDDGAAVFPLWHVVAALAAASGSTLHHVTTQAPVMALAWEAPGGPRLMLANRSPQPVTVRVEGAGTHLQGRILDIAAFREATREPEAFGARSLSFLPEAVALGPYATAILQATR